MFKRLLFVSALISSVFASYYSQPAFAEDITITTYYPSPFGSYRELRSQRMAIGPNYFGSTYCWPPTVCANQIGSVPLGQNVDLVVEDRVGIGTFTPSGSLEVAGGIRAVTGRPTNNNSDVGYSFGPDGDTGMFRIGGTGMFPTFTGGDLIFALDQAERVRIVANGNVGIGTTTSPEAKLEVNVGDNDRIALYKPPAPAFNNTLAIQTLLDGRALSTYGAYGGNSENRLVLQPLVGNVGINNTNPVATLDVGVRGGAGTLHVSGGNPATPIQGAYIGWNASGGIGETNFINQRGLGIGGFDFMESTLAGAKTTLATLNTWGLKIKNSFQDKIVFEGPNADWNTIVDNNNKGFRFWNSGTGALLTIDRLGQVSFLTAAVPLSFYETDTGVWWRMPVDGGSLRFDKFYGGVGWRTKIIMDDLHALFAFGVIESSLGYFGHSDLRSKKNIKTLNNPLDKLLKLRGVSFDWRQDEEFKKYNFSKGRQIGMIAQEMEQQFPELVLTDPDGTKSIGYDKFTVVLLEGIKAQQAEIKELKARLDKIEAASKR